MKIPPFLTLTLLSIALLAPMPAVAAEASEIEEKNPTFDLRFEGGSLVDLVQRIEEQLGRHPNVIIGRKARDLEVPSFELYSVTVDDVFFAYTLLAGHNPAIRVVVDKSGDIWIFDVREPQPEAPDPVIPHEPEPEAITQVFQVSPFLDVYDLADLTTAIETYWNLAGVEENAGLRYHEDTQLLFVRGSHRQVEVVEQVLVAIRPELDRLREERRARELMEARIEAALKTAQMEIDLAEVWVDELPEGAARDQAGFWESRIESLAAARDRLLEMRAQLGDGHPALEEYLETLETHRTFVSGHRQRLMSLLESNRGSREQTQNTQQSLYEMAKEIRERRAVRQLANQEATTEPEPDGTNNR